MAATPITDFKEFRLLVEVQGPFVSTGILRDTFPQGFPKEDPFSKGKVTFRHGHRRLTNL